MTTYLNVKDKNMSLILRQKCQPILDSFGLSALHARLNGRVLSLSGECGRTVVDIKGIVFSNTKPAIHELEYALELLKKFLEKEGEAVLNYTRAAKDFKENHVPTVPDGWTFNGAFIMYKSPTGGVISVEKDGRVMINMYTSIENAKRLLEAAEDPRIPEYFLAREEMNKKSLELNALHRKLASCDI